jgi:cephalosporin hydroxylase
MKVERMNPTKSFEEEVQQNIARLGADPTLPKESFEWMLKAGTVGGYTYNFRWLGRPIIQYPQDMVAMQELIWVVRPDLIIETGIAHGGSVVLSASMLAMLDMIEAIESGIVFDPAKSKRKVLGIDIDIRAHNREAIESHPMASRIQMIEGSSVDDVVIGRVHEVAADYKRILVCLDSNHTHDHVLAELKAYAPLVSVGSYCVVFDTVIDDMPADFFPNRSWGPGNNPKTAIQEYLKSNPQFSVDKAIDNKLLISVAAGGYLKRID